MGRARGCDEQPEQEQRADGLGRFAGVEPDEEQKASGAQGSTRHLKLLSVDATRALSRAQPRGRRLGGPRPAQPF